MSELPSSTPSSEHTFSVTLTTTLALIDQFSTSISGSGNQSSVPANGSPVSSTPSPLPLLSASTASLKAQSTKLSLLTLTPPFTPSAVSTILSALNSSILPSLLTAALLISSEEYKYTASFSAEVRSLVKATLRDLHALLSCVERRSKYGDPRAQLGDQQKSSVTEAVGRVWETCDELVALADGGVGAFVVKKAELWLGLIKDAVDELGEWDPEEDGIDGLFGEDAQQDDGAGKHAEEGSAAAEIAKAGAMKVVTRVPQSLHVVVKQRLRKWKWNLNEPTTLPNTKANHTGPPSSSDHVNPHQANESSTLDEVLRGMQHVSETVDEMAEALYMGQLTRSGRLVEDIWKATVGVVEAVRRPEENHAKYVNGNNAGEEETETAEDKYVRRALNWIKVVEPKSPPSSTVTSGSMQEVRDG